MIGKTYLHKTIDLLVFIYIFIYLFIFFFFGGGGGGESIPLLMIAASDDSVFIATKFFTKIFVPQ